MAHNGQLQTAQDDGGPRRKSISLISLLFIDTGHLTPSKSVILSHPGPVYRGQAYFDPEHLPQNNGTSNNRPVLKLPLLQTKSTQYDNDDQNDYQPAKFYNNSRDAPTPQAAYSTERRKSIPMSMQTV